HGVGAFRRGTESVGGLFPSPDSRSVPSASASSLKTRGKEVGRPKEAFMSPCSRPERTRKNTKRPPGPRAFARSAGRRRSTGTRTHLVVGRTSDIQRSRCRCGERLHLLGVVRHWRGPLEPSKRRIRYGPIPAAAARLAMLGVLHRDSLRRASLACSQRY